MTTRMARMETSKAKMASTGRVMMWMWTWMSMCVLLHPSKARLTRRRRALRSRRKSQTLSLGR